METTKFKPGDWIIATTPDSRSGDRSWMTSPIRVTEFTEHHFVYKHQYGDNPGIMTMEEFNSRNFILASQSMLRYPEKQRDQEN